MNENTAKNGEEVPKIDDLPNHNEKHDTISKNLEEDSEEKDHSKLEQRDSKVTMPIEESGEPADQPKEMDDMQ